MSASPERGRSRSADVAIDTRPLWRILVERAQTPGIILLGMVSYASVRALPLPDGLTPAGQKALAVFVLCLVYWVSNVIPLVVTSILAMTLLPLTGVLSAKETYSLFGNEAVFFILGVFILAAALMKCGLSTRLALTMLRRFGRTPTRLLLSLFLMNALLSFFMSEHAVAAMTFPITLEIATVLQLRPRQSNYGRALFIAMAWGTQIGGIATLLGGGPAPPPIGMRPGATGQGFSFSEWSLTAWPIVVVLLVAGWTILIRWFPVDIESVGAADAIIDEKVLRMGRMSFRERAIGLVMLGTLVIWILGGEELGLASVALGAVVVIFALQLLTWSEVE